MMMLLLPLVFIRFLPFNSILYGLCIIVVAIVFAEMCLQQKSTPQIIKASKNLKTPRNSEEQHEIKLQQSIQSGDSFRVKTPNSNEYDNAIESLKNALKYDIDNGKKKDPYLRMIS